MYVVVKDRCVNERGSLCTYLGSVCQWTVSIYVVVKNFKHPETTFNFALFATTLYPHSRTLS